MTYSRSNDIHSSARASLSHCLNNHKVLENDCLLPDSVEKKRFQTAEFANVLVK